MHNLIYWGTYCHVLDVFWCIRKKVLRALMYLCCVCLFWKWSMSALICGVTNLHKHTIIKMHQLREIASNALCSKSLLPRLCALEKKKSIYTFTNAYSWLNIQYPEIKVLVWVAITLLIAKCLAPYISELKQFVRIEANGIGTFFTKLFLQPLR